jgi:hypothetical protein
MEEAGRPAGLSKRNEEQAVHRFFGIANSVAARDENF